VGALDCLELRVFGLDAWKGEACQAKPEILCHVSVIFMQIRQMTRNIWIKKDVGWGGGHREGVGLPVLYLQDGVNKTKIS